jgi:hypothetical protein
MHKEDDNPNKTRLVTRLVNQKTCKRFDVKIDRSGVFGNPHPIGYCSICNTVHDRRGSIDAYREYFYTRLLTDQNFRDKVLALKGKVLACWCHPLECHGDVIIEVLENDYDSTQTSQTI